MDTRGRAAITVAQGRKVRGALRFVLLLAFLPGPVWAAGGTAEWSYLHCYLCNGGDGERSGFLGGQPWPELDLPPAWIALRGRAESPGPDPQAGNEQNQQAGKEKQKKRGSSGESGSPGHIFWVIPAFKVNYQKGFKPLTRREKFDEWARNAYDPLGLAVGAFEAGALEYSSKEGFCGYGPGWGGYGKCFGAAELDANVSSFIGDFALTVLLHQDPRYFRRGEGSSGRRFLYAVSRVFVTHSDSGRTTFYTSALAGTAIAAGLSNLYYPRKDRGAGLTVSRMGFDLGNTAIYNVAAEFWPEVRRGLHRIF